MYQQTQSYKQMPQQVQTVIRVTGSQKSIGFWIPKNLVTADRYSVQWNADQVTLVADPNGNLVSNNVPSGMAKYCYVQFGGKHFGFTLKRFQSIETEASILSGGETIVLKTPTLKEKAPLSPTDKRSLRGNKKPPMVQLKEAIDTVNEIANTQGVTLKLFNNLLSGVINL